MNKLQKRLLAALTLLVLIISAFSILKKVMQKPDVIISNIETLTYRYLETITYSVTIKNIGHEPVLIDEPDRERNSGLTLSMAITSDTIHQDLVRQSGNQIYSINLDQGILEPGQSVSDTIKVIKPKLLIEGEYVCLIINQDKRVKEMDEDNNVSCALLYTDSEKEDLKLREVVPIEEYLEHFTEVFPEGVYLGVPPPGETWTLSDAGYDYPLSHKVISLDNGTLLGPISGIPYAIKNVNDDIIWISTNEFGTYGGAAGFLLYVLNIRKNTLSEGYQLAETFAEDGWYDYQDGEFIDDSTFQYRHYWNDESFKRDSAFGTIIIK